MDVDRYFGILILSYADLWVGQAEGSSGCIPVLGEHSADGRRQQEEPDCATHSEITWCKYPYNLNLIDINQLQHMMMMLLWYDEDDDVHKLLFEVPLFKTFYTFSNMRLFFRLVRWSSQQDGIIIGWRWHFPKRKAGLAIVPSHGWDLRRLHSV